MNKKMILILLIMLVMASGVFAASGPKVNEGLWQITTEIEMPAVPGMPGLGSTQHTQRQCITNKNLVPDLSKQTGQDCKTLDTTVNGDTVSWNMECNNNGTVTKGRGRITYEENTLHGTTFIQITNPFKKDKGNNVKMKTRIKGRRIGDCGK